MSRVRFNGTLVAARNALRFHKTKAAAYEYNWNKEDDHLLPEHYKKRCEEFMKQNPKPVHYIPEQTRWKTNPETKLIELNEDNPIEVLYPEECNYGLWGGEGIVVADRIARWKRKRSLAIPRIWRPNLYRRVLYSEILDTWYNIVVTLRTCDLIDEANGLDFYILKTHERDLNSRLGMFLRRKMLLTLVRKEMYPDDPEKREKIYNRYKEFIIPEDEAEWIGLSISEALEKGRERVKIVNPTIPMKYKLAKALTHKLQELEEKDELTTTLNIKNPFKSKDKEKES